MATRGDACRQSCERQPPWLHSASTVIVVLLAMTMHPIVSPSMRRKLWTGRWASSPLHLPLQLLAASSLAFSMTGNVSDTLAVLVAFVLLRVTFLELL